MKTISEIYYFMTLSYNFEIFQLTLKYLIQSYYPLHGGRYIQPEQDKANGK